jgi:hypothetical protein
VYIAVQLADVRASNKGLLQELARVQELLEVEKARRASPQPSEAGGPNQPSVSALADIISSELKQIKQSIASLKVADCRTATQQPQAPMSMPALPMGGMPNLPPMLDMRKGKTGSALPLPPDLAEETRAYVESVFKENAEEARRPVTEEIDPQHPDPTLLRRIMEQSREDLKSQLQGVLPQEDFERFFPTFPAPGAVTGQSNVLPRGQTPTQE